MTRMSEQELAEAKAKNLDLERANQHVHLWRFEKYEKAISLGTCVCKAHRFFSGSTDIDFVTRAVELNEELAALLG